MLNKDTLYFLSQLDKNNNRAWFENNKNLYHNARINFESFIQHIVQKNLNMWPELTDIPIKKLTFRIYKDVRFSKDKLPYKVNFGATLGNPNKKIDSPNYYIHIQPNNKSFIGGGLWMPNKDNLQAIRQEIDYNFKTFESIILKPSFKKHFANLDQELKLVKCPKGYEESNEAIEYLKLKSFTISKPLLDDEVCSKSIVTQITNILHEVKPFIQFLNTALYH